MSLPEDMQTFLREARTCDEAPDEKGAVLRELVDRRIAAEPAAAGVRLFALRIAAPVGLAALALATGVVVLGDRDPVTPPVAESAALASPKRAASETARPEERPAPEPVIEVRDLPDAPKAPTFASAVKPPIDRSIDIDSSLEIETRILREARAARLAGAADRCLSLVEEHASRFPNGALAPERDAERISALCAVGRVEEARQRIAEFERRGASAALLGRVRASCGGAR